MEIFVLVKQVPSTESIPEISENGKSIIENDLNWIMNPYDEIAVETALQIIEDLGGKVTLISTGPERVLDCIRTGLAMGADRGVLIDHHEASSINSFKTAEILASYIKKQHYDLIITGQKAVDYDFGITGIALSEFLNIPGIPLVTGLETITEDTLVCRRETEGGYDIIETGLPALITVQRGIYEPRFTSLKGIMKARKKTIDQITENNVTGLFQNEGSNLTITSMKLPTERKAGELINGETDMEKVDKLVTLLREKERII